MTEVTKGTEATIGAVSRPLSLELFENSAALQLKAMLNKALPKLRSYSSINAKKYNRSEVNLIDPEEELLVKIISGDWHTEVNALHIESCSGCQRQHLWINFSSTVQTIFATFPATGKSETSYAIERLDEMGGAEKTLLAVALGLIESSASTPAAS